MKMDLQRFIENVEHFEKSKFLSDVEIEYQYAKESLNIFSLLRFGTGKRIFNWISVKIVEEYIQRDLESNNSKPDLGTKWTVALHKSIGELTGDFEMYNKSSKILQAHIEQREEFRKLSNKVILESQKIHRFKSSFTLEQINALRANLTSNPFNFINANQRDGLFLFFGREMPENLELHFPLTWNGTNKELLLLFMILIDKRHISSEELVDLHKSLSNNFIKSDGKPIIADSLKREKNRLIQRRVNSLDDLCLSKDTRILRICKIVDSLDR